MAEAFHPRANGRQASAIEVGPTGPSGRGEPGPLRLREANPRGARASNSLTLIQFGGGWAKRLGFGATEQTHAEMC